MNPFAVLRPVSHEENTALLRSLFGGEWPGTGTELLLLARDAVAEYDRRCELSEVPHAPWLRRKDRPSFFSIGREEIGGRYEKAVTLGFDGSRNDWRRFCYDQRSPEERRDGR